MKIGLVFFREITTNEPTDLPITISADFYKCPWGRDSPSLLPVLPCLPSTPSFSWPPSLPVISPVLSFPLPLTLPLPLKSNLGAWGSALSSAKRFWCIFGLKLAYLFHFYNDTIVIFTVPFDVYNGNIRKFLWGQLGGIAPTTFWPWGRSPPSPPWNRRLCGSRYLVAEVVIVKVMDVGSGYSERVKKSRWLWLRACPMAELQVVILRHHCYMTTEWH